NVLGMKKTKIIATIGPATESPEKMEQLMHKGVNVFRFNMKHNTLEWHQEKIEQANTIAQKLGQSLGILIDLQGPEIRIDTSQGKDITVSPDKEIICIKSDAEDIPESCVMIPHTEVFDALEIGDRFTIDDGYVQLEVTAKENNMIKARALNENIIKTRKSLNLVQKDIPLPSLTENDLEKLEIAKKIDVDFIALSFVRDKTDINNLKGEMMKREITAKIVAKVESQKGVDNIDEIIDTADVIMIARGDLGIETPIETITYFQKQTIKKCRKKHKPVIVATQMLESMINNPLPTRAEVADVANAVFDLTDCVMLSGESASGKYPDLTAETMTKIIAYNEPRIEKMPLVFGEYDYTKNIAHSAVAIADTSEVSKIVAFTETGYTARVLSSFRPRTEIIAVTNHHKTKGALTMSYGVIPVETHYPVGDIVSYTGILEDLVSEGYISKGDEIIMIHGHTMGTPGNTNSLTILKV
ncbi:pyruvate kinase, partial [candidate division WWE3 bacterium]|nr:pyruvate kinase [candidate division WWE3 bacterium]